MWKPQVEFLSKGFKVITYDLRGFGNSSIPNNSKYSHVDDLKELLKHLGVDRVSIIGHSFGSAIAVDFTLKYPKMVDKIVLIAPSLSGYYSENKLWEELREFGKKGDTESIREEILSHKMFKNLRNENKELIQRIIRDYKAWHFLHRDPREDRDAMNRLRELNLPVKIIMGSEDSDIQKEVIEKLRKDANAKIEIIEDSGHMVNLEKPHIVNNLISSFTVL
jgi:pimeloyl-ACP methyl ester carboxylesterase